MSEPDLQSALELVQAQLNQNTLLMMRAKERIAALEGQIQVQQRALIEQSGRINVMRMALREIKDCLLSPDQSSAIARAALAGNQDK